MTYTASESRYQVPQTWFRRCGASGLQLPAISLGCWHNFGAPGADSMHHSDDASMHENCRQMIFAAFDNGITHIDVANNYGPPAGAAEARVGRILKEDLARYRDELVIATKAGYEMWPGPYGNWGSRKYLLASLDQSLKRLGLDYVDIFYSHRPDPNTPLEETIGALETAVRQGKALYTGISSYKGARTQDVVDLCEKRGWTKPIISQPRYHMLERWLEDDLLPVTSRSGIGIIGFCPLAQGVLTSRYLQGIPDDSRARSFAGFLKKQDRLAPETMARVTKLNAIAQARGQTLAQLAIQWTLRPQRFGSVASALIGASRPAQIIENVKAMQFPPISREEVDSIDQILKA